MRKPYRVENTVETISHISRIGEVAILVRYERLVFSEIQFLAQFLNHFYRRIVKRYVTFACFTFQLTNLYLEFTDVIQAISNVYFLYATL